MAIPVQIVVNGLGGPCCTVEASTEWTVLQVQQAIFDKITVPVEWQTLVHGKGKLPSEATVGSLLPAEGTTSLELMLVVQKRLSLILNEAQYQRLMEELETVGVRQLRLLYRGSRDGFTGESFHQCCDHQGPTVTLCKSAEHHLFGGYVDVPWDESKQFKVSNTNTPFLFKVGQLQEVAFSRHSVVETPDTVIFCYPAADNGGPCFGHFDLVVTLTGAAVVHFQGFGSTYDRGPDNVPHLAEDTYCSLQELEVFAAS